MMGSVAEILEKKKVRYIRIDGATSRFDFIIILFCISRFQHPRYYI